MIDHSTQKAYKTSLKHLASLKEYVGKELGLTEWITLTQDRINTFADATGDHQWIHTDVERARRESPYGSPIAHGFLILSLASKFAYETYELEDVGMGINYGLDKIRFPNATPVGAEVRGRVSLIEFRDIPGGARFKTKVVFELKGQEKPACVAECITQAYIQS